MTRPALRRWAAPLASVGVHAAVVVAWWLATPAGRSDWFQVGQLDRIVSPPIVLSDWAPPSRPAPAHRTGPAVSRRTIPEEHPAAVDAPQSGPAPVAAELPTADAPVNSPPLPIERQAGESRLWVRPLTPEQLSALHRLRLNSAGLADSAIRAMVQVYLDSMAAEAARQPGPPSWTGTIAGAKFGLDSRYVYVAGLRIPSILLALLPIPATGNQSHAFDRSGALSEDLKRAEVRAAIQDDFKAAVVELRTSTELEHRLRTVPGSAPEEAPITGSP
jgi:hypothetical protein